MRRGRFWARGRAAVEPTTPTCSGWRRPRPGEALRRRRRFWDVADPCDRARQAPAAAGHATLAAYSGCQPTAHAAVSSRGNITPTCSGRWSPRPGGGPSARRGRLQGLRGGCGPSDVVRPGCVRGHVRQTGVGRPLSELGASDGAVVPRGTFVAWRRATPNQTSAPQSAPGRANSSRSSAPRRAHGVHPRTGISTCRRGRFWGHSFPANPLQM